MNESNLSLGNKNFGDIAMLVTNWRLIMWSRILVTKVSAWVCESTNYSESFRNSILVKNELENNHVRTLHITSEYEYVKKAIINDSKSAEN